MFIFICICISTSTRFTDSGHYQLIGFDFFLWRDSENQQFIYLVIYSLFWQTDLHLHCREWDNLLNKGDWSPEVIAGTLPDFFCFMKKVQAIVLEGEGKKY